MWHLNTEAVEAARERIEDGSYRISTPWARVQPTPEAAARYAHEAGLAAYSRWYLAVDPTRPVDDPARYGLLVGDFKSVHRSALAAAQNQAIKDGQAEIAAAADDLLFIFDRLTAC